MLGAIIGDTVGSVYEFDNIKSTEFQPFIHPEANYTDDSIMTAAVADWLLHTDRSQLSLEKCLVSWAKNYPCPMGGYGGGFRTWLFNPDQLNDYDGTPFGDGKRHPYNSWGNGSAMRASACGWAAKSLEEALNLGKQSAEITHNHPEGIKGAQATAAAVFLALHRMPKEEIRAYIESTFGYDLNHTCDEIRSSYGWEASCQGTVPQAIIAWLDSNSFEEAIRLAVSLGGDSDTLACITGGIAEAYAWAHSSKYDMTKYGGIAQDVVDQMKVLLPREMWILIQKVHNLPYGRIDQYLPLWRYLRDKTVNGMELSHDDLLDIVANTFHFGDINLLMPFITPDFVFQSEYILIGPKNLDESLNRVQEYLDRDKGSTLVPVKSPSTGSTWLTFNYNPRSSKLGIIVEGGKIRALGLFSRICD